MSSNGEAAEQVTRIILDGTEVLLKLTGRGAERAAVLVYTTLRQQEKTKGAARLSSMLRSGKPLKVYTFEEKDLPKFKEVAKQYGVLYSILKEKDKTGGVFDVLVRADDENKINRIIERFSLTKLDTTSLKVELEKEKSEREQTKATDAEKNPDNVAEQKEVPEQERPQKSRSDIVADELMGAPVQKEVKVQGNPDMARTENTETVSSETLSYVETNHLSEPSLKDIRNPTDRNEGRSDKSGKKPSVRAELNKLKKAREQKIKNESKHRNKAPIKNNKPKVK
ncbi:MAG: PcfB family protein [Clostridia bacterium]|nr:PcfB family protein [Clostridia bacterium]